MFGFFKKKPPKPHADERPSGGPILAFLLLEGDTFPFEGLIQQLSKKKKLAGQPVSEVESSEGGTLTFKVGDELVAMGLMPAPYPASDLEGPLATSWMWPPEAKIEDVKRHRSHLLITLLNGTATPVRRRLTLAAITALAARQPGVMAVYWPDATMVHYPPLFAEMADSIQSPEAPPLYLWVDYRTWVNDDGSSGLFTTGLAPLGHMELEIPRIDMPPGELRDWAVNITYYLLEKGPILLDGQTVGVSAEHQVRIRHTESSFGHPGKVIRLEP
ncbi:MAG: DUF4261 domain-containing protein [Isosphaeraceae bacterium]